MKKRSTGALTQDELIRQSQRHAAGVEYDTLIIGSGMSSLSLACLLAQAGERVCILEGHDSPGGFAHSFQQGDYHFCAQVHYVWGCAPGGPVFEFLRKLGLHEEITWNLFESDGYDHMVMPDGKRVRIPYGFDRLVENLEEAYPGQGEPTRRFCAILTAIREELRHLPEGPIRWWQYLTLGPKCLTLLRHRNSTLQDVFDLCGLSREAQAVLIANAGDFMAPPRDLSVFGYAALFGGYNTGAYYPTRHFKHLTERLARFISEHEGCEIFYESEVTEIHTEGKRVTSVRTEDGKTFRAKRFVSNMDPARAADLIGREKFPREHLQKLDYSYSPSGVIVYLGIEGIDLRDYGFGNHNTWQMFQWDMNQIWDDALEEHDFDSPWLFISTPTLHTDDGGVVPEGGQIMELLTLTGYDIFRHLKDEDPAAYTKAKNAVGERLIDLVVEHHVPELRSHITLKTIGSPVTHETYCRATRGNAYGSYLTPVQLGKDRLKSDTPLDNLYWCNASSGYAGVNGTISTGMRLYMNLTEDRFFNPATSPSDRELLTRLAERDTGEHV